MESLVRSGEAGILRSAKVWSGCAWFGIVWYVVVWYVVVWYGF